MARRRMTKKSKPRTRRSRAFNIVNAAEMYATSSVLTQNFAGTNPISFLTGIEYGNVAGSGSTGMQRPTAKMGFAYNPSGASVTIPEMLGLGNNASVGNGLDVISQNIQAHFIPAMLQYAGVKIGFKVGKKLLSKQRSFLNNDVIKPLLGKNMVRV